MLVDAEVDMKTSVQRDRNEAPRVPRDPVLACMCGM